MLIVLLGVLAGCSVRECKLDGAYLQAREAGPLVSAESGNLPVRDPSYDIPPIPKQEQVASRSYTTSAGEERQDCIDRPPRLPPAQASES